MSYVRVPEHFLYTCNGCGAEDRIDMTEAGINRPKGWVAVTTATHSGPRQRHYCSTCYPAIVAAVNDIETRLMNLSKAKEKT